MANKALPDRPFQTPASSDGQVLGVLWVTAVAVALLVLMWAL